MSADSARRIRSAAVVVRCAELDEALAFLTERAGFRLETIFPADDPAVAVVSGYGVRLRLERGPAAGPAVLRLACDDLDGFAGGETRLTGPGGLVVEFVRAEAPDEVPPGRPSFTLTRGGGGSAWITGRAGMLYRDLIPDRYGGRFIASHIRIPEGGEVPDYVHFHRIRFQMIYCYRGWVRLVYEDQGPPFVLEAGDCVLQPPRIRHRVLECSDGLEVIELACPAAHATHADHDLRLPTTSTRPERDFGGQRFVRHQAAAAAWHPWRATGFTCRDTGIAAATGALAGVRVVRPTRGGAETAMTSAESELLFLFVLAGSASLERAGQAPEALTAADALTMPAGMRHALARCSEDLELLEVSLPAVVETA